jgi:hypothetical protein
MRTKTIIISVILIFAVTSFTSGQVGGYLKSKANRAVNAGARAADNKANEEIDKNAQKAVDDAAKKLEEDAAKTKAENEKKEQAEKPEGTQEQKKDAKQESGGINLGALMGGGTVTSKYKESYSFNNRIFMQAEMYDGKDVVKMDYYLYFNDASPDAGVESKITGTTDEANQVAVGSAFIFDGANKSFMMLSDLGGTKFGMISDVPDETTTQGQTGTTTKPTVTKTGNSKVIAGYKCDEYIVKEANKKEYSKLWVTKDLKLKADKRTFSKAGVSPYYDNPELRDGATLATESYDDKGKLAMKSETKEIKLGFKHTMSPKGYPLRQMNFNQTGTQK